MGNVVITSLRLLLLFTLLTGLIYPLTMTGFAQLVFPEKANGSLILKDGKIVGSTLIGQFFTEDKYFHGRPSVAGNNGGYVAMASGGSNLGPTSKKLFSDVQIRIQNIKKENNLKADTVIPSDLLLASASGLDPHITTEAAYLQADRIAKARNLNINVVKELIESNTEEKLLDLVGEKRVNVLLLNLALDKMK